MAAMTNLIGHKLEDRMKLKYIVVKLVLLSLIIGCTQLEEANEDVTELSKEISEDIIVPKDSKSYVSGGSYNTIGIEQDNKTLACIKYSTTIKKGVLIDLDSSEIPTIKIQSIEVNPDQIKLCNEYFNSQEYTHTAISSEAFQYTTNGYIFDENDIKFLIENGKIIGLDLNADNKSDYLNTCSSIESEHLSVWEDKLKKARLAYASRHIDADLLETCGNIDYPESH